MTSIEKRHVSINIATALGVAIFLMGFAWKSSNYINTIVTELKTTFTVTLNDHEVRISVLESKINK